MKTKLMIGGVEVENPVFFAPLAGVSVAAVRRLFRRLGAALTHTEMVSSAGLLYAGPKTWQMTECTDEERPLVLQLFTGDADSLCRSAERCLQSRSYAAFGVNMACPMPKVHKKGAGSRLLQNPDVAFAMVRELKKFGLPVWPKIRKIVPDGREYRLDTLQFAEGLLEAGADNVTIHGRTPQQRTRGKPIKAKSSARRGVSKARSPLRETFTPPPTSRSISTTAARRCSAPAARSPIRLWSCTLCRFWVIITEYYTAIPRCKNARKFLPAWRTISIGFMAGGSRALEAFSFRIFQGASGDCGIQTHAGQRERLGFCVQDPPRLALIF